MEVEVMSPIVDLPADDGSYTFTEDWWAANVDGPIISVTNAGAVKSFEYDMETNHFTGEFGVFYIAKARLEFMDSTGTIIDSSSTYNVTPLQTFTLDDSTNLPLQTDSVRVVLLDNQNQYIGTLISKSMASLVTSIQPSTTHSPTGFNLKQNFPNPFNPKTTIVYHVRAIDELPLQVDLSIYNLLGQKVATLVNKRQRAGSYTVEWDASGFASGVYYYRIVAGDFQQVKKMLLVE